MTSLNGEPEQDIALEAQGVDNCGGVTEESVSDQEGKFRIRGLQVLTYTILFPNLFEKKVIID